MEWRSSTVRWKVGLAAFAACTLLLDLWGLSRLDLAMSPDARASLAADIGDRERGWWPVHAMEPRSPLTKAGVKPGETVRFDRAGDARRYLERGEPIGLSVRDASGTVRHVEVRAVAEPVKRHEAIETWMIVSGTLLMLAVGTLVGWRGADSVPLRALSASLLSQTLHLPSAFLPGGALQDFLANIAPALTFAIAYVAFMYFALRYADWPLLGERRGRMAYRVYCALFAIDTIVVLGKRVAPDSVFDTFPTLALGSALALFSSVASLLILVGGWRRASGSRRQRLAWIALCLGAIDVAYFSGNFARLLQSDDAIIAADLAAGTLISAGNAGLAYAVLRHRVLDFGFAVNRALVYGTTSLFLAAAFMLASQVLNRLLQFEAREDHRILDIAIGLGLALTARQAVRWVDPRVQRIFFRRWHAAASKLAAFRIDAIHGRDPQALRVEFLHAVMDYAEAQGAAFYRATETGELRRIEATGAALPAQIEPHDPLVPALDAASGAVEVGRTSSILPAALALPMKAHGRLVGVVLVCPKPDAEPFRPDERKQLAQTAQQVGIELELARLREFESRVQSAPGTAAPAKKGKRRKARAR